MKKEDASLASARDSQLWFGVAYFTASNNNNSNNNNNNNERILSTLLTLFHNLNSFVCWLVGFLVGFI